MTAPAATTAPFADGDAEEDRGTSGNPDIVFDHDWLCHEGEVRRLDIMRACQQTDVLANATPRSDLNRGKSVDPSIVPDFNRRMSQLHIR